MKKLFLAMLIATASVSTVIVENVFAAQAPAPLCACGQPCWFDQKNQNYFTKCRRTCNGVSQAQPAAAAAPQAAGTIYFYNKTDPYYEFTNFYSAPIIDENNDRWSCSEVYFQAQKFNHNQAQKFNHNQALYDQFKLITNPRDAFNLAQTNKATQSPVWTSISLTVMENALIFKFTQHADLAKLLVSTGTATLIEHSPVDAFWGDGNATKNGHVPYTPGKNNQLGELLMKIRNNPAVVKAAQDSSFPSFRTISYVVVTGFLVLAGFNYYASQVAQAAEVARIAEEARLTAQAQAQADLLRDCEQSSWFKSSCNHLRK